MLLKLDLRHLHGHSLASINTIPTSRDNGKENGNYYSIMGYNLILYWDNGKENGNNYSIMGYNILLYWDNGKENGNYQNHSPLWPFFHAAKSHCGNHTCNP